MKGALFRLLALTFFPMLIIALILKFAGVDTLTGESMRQFLLAVNRNFVDFNFEIPKVPSISISASGGNDILAVLIQLTNGVIQFLNFLVTILNMIVQLIIFIVAILTTLFQWVANVVTSSVTG